MSRFIPIFCLIAIAFTVPVVALGKSSFLLASNGTTICMSGNPLDDEHSTVLPISNAYEQSSKPGDYMCMCVSNINAMPMSFFVRKYVEFGYKDTLNLLAMGRADYTDYILDDSTAYTNTDRISKTTILHIISSSSDLSTGENFISALRNSDYPRKDTSIEWHPISLDTNYSYSGANRLAYLSPLLSRDNSSRNFWSELKWNDRNYNKYGEINAEQLNTLLEGEPIESLSAIDDPQEYSNWAFDKFAMDLHNGHKDDLPTGALVLSMIPSVWVTNSEFSYGTLTLITVGSAIAVLYSIYTHARNKARKVHDYQQIQHMKELQKNEQELKRLLIAAEEATKAKSAFLANMSHEIRTPINSILGFSSLALYDDIPQKTRDYLNKIISSSEGLLMIVNDILDISKIEADKVVLESIPFDIHDIFTSCNDSIMPFALEKDITVDCYVDQGVDKMLLGDPTRLRQALLNLLSNAVKFTSSGTVRLSATVDTVTSEGVVIFFEVRDNGIGMTSQQLDIIFEPFTQADVSTTRMYGGTGLGLPISKKIIEAMGGKINVDSLPGVGSTFSFALKFKITDTPVNRQAALPEPINIKRPMFSGVALICEDNSLNRQVICENLSRVGIKTEAAVNGFECLEMVTERIRRGDTPFDLIFMDMHMPVMDGLEATKRLKDMGVQTPIIALTANIMTNDKKTYAAHGIPDFLGKPFTAKELWGCISKYLEPVGVSVESKIAEATRDKLLNELIVEDFLEANRNASVEIRKAIERKDISAAHLKVHNLKGMAGLIGQNALRSAADAMEKTLIDGNLPRDVDIANMERMLNATLQEMECIRIENERTKPKSEYGQAPMSEEILAVFDKLETLLLNNNFDCLEYMLELERSPETKHIAKLISNFEFKDALKAIEELRGLI